MPASNPLLISNFLGYLQYERCTAENAVAAHEQSLAHLATWLAPMWLPDASRTTLQLYIGDSLTKGMSARTIARRLSHFRHFYQFLLNEKEIKSDPTQGLSMPQHQTKGPLSMVTWIRMEWDAY